MGLSENAPGSTCKFLSSLQLRVGEGFLEKAASELGCGGLIHKLCIWKALLEVEPACLGGEGGVRDGDSQLGKHRSGQERHKEEHTGQGWVTDTLCHQ